LIDGPVALTPYRPHEPMRPATAARVATLERRAPRIVDRAREAGVEIQYLGSSPLFAEHRLYRGPESDWVFGPADEHEPIVIPRPQRQVLTRLSDAGIDFPLTYYAHEIQKQVSDAPAGTATALVRQDASALVGPVPPPAQAIELSDRLGQRSAQLLRAVGRAAPVVGEILLGVAAAPFVLAAGAIAGLATLDPIVFGAIPAGAAEPGQPALWYLLVRWDW
jgi:hypothetical protein